MSNSSASHALQQASQALPGKHGIERHSPSFLSIRTFGRALFACFKTKQDQNSYVSLGLSKGIYDDKINYRLLHLTNAQKVDSAMQNIKLSQRSFYTFLCI